VNNLDLELELNDVGYFANAMYRIDPSNLEGEEVCIILLSNSKLHI
jgi:hypothetical protein